MADTDLWDKSMAQCVNVLAVFTYPIKRRRSGVYYDDRRGFFAYASLEEYLDARNDRREFGGMVPVISFHVKSLLDREKSVRPVGTMFWWYGKNHEQFGDMVFIGEEAGNGRF